MIPEFDIPFDRVTWRNGQRLRSRDLSDAHTRNQRLRWLHNKYLHGAAEGNWGIASGYTTSLLAGGKVLGVRAGYAVDPNGRDLLLTEDIAVALPAVTAPRELFLVARYQEDAVYREARRATPACEGRALISRNERPLFVWVDSSEWRDGRDVVIALVLITPSGPVLGDGAARRYLRTHRRLQMASGVTNPAVWTRPGEGSAYIETRVDTSAAGFVRQPCYLATLRRDGADVLAHGVTYVASATAFGFVFRILMGFGALGFPEGITQATKGSWQVSWFGVEPSSFPPSAITPNLYLHLSGYAITP